MFWIALLTTVITILSLYKMHVCLGLDAKRHESLNKLSKLLLLLIALQVIWVFFKTYEFPIIQDDALGVWAIKAKLLYYHILSGASMSEWFETVETTASGNYPLLIPSLEAMINFLSGGWSDSVPKFIFPSLYGCLIYFFFRFTERHIGRNQAMVFAFMLATLSFLTEQATWAVADLPLALFTFLSLASMYEWISGEKARYLIFSAIFSVLAIWTKNQGYPALIINLLILNLFIMRGAGQMKNLRFSLGWYVLILFLGCWSIISYQAGTGVEEGIINSDTLSTREMFSKLDRLPFILNQFQKQLFGAFNKWNLTGYLFVAASIGYSLNKSKGREGYLLIAIALYFSLYSAVYVLTPQDVEVHMNTSQNRILLHFIPIVMYFTALAGLPGMRAARASSPPVSA